MASHMGAAPYWPTHCYHSTRQHTMPLVPEHKTQYPPPLPPMPYCPISMGHHPYDLCRWHSIATSPQIPNPSITQHQLQLLRSLQSAAITTLWNAFTSRAFGHNPTPSHVDITSLLLGRLLYLCSIDIHIDPLTPWISPNKIQSFINTSRNRYIPPSPNTATIWAFILFLYM